MTSTGRLSGILVVSAVLVGACSGATTTPTPAPVSQPPATQAPAVTTPAAAPTPTTVPMTDGQGAEHFTGTSGSGPTLVADFSQIPAASDMTQFRGGVVTFSFTTNDVRMAGTAIWQVNVDAYGTVGPEWGPFEVKNDHGTWTGSCSAGAWQTGDLLVSGCWLTGTGDYVGYTAYFSLYAVSASKAGVEGVIYPGSPPRL